MKYILGIDQSTQGTKAILIDESGTILGRSDRSHRQIINEYGWVSHDLNEIYSNTLLSVQDVIAKCKISSSDIQAVGISNQRETTAIWDKTGMPLNHAIVWQCSRAKDIAQEKSPYSDDIQERTGLRLSPYFPAAKMAWLLQNTDGVQDMCSDDLRLGTIDSWLIYKLTCGKSFKTDYSNASRTQLFNIHTLSWDKKICEWFQIPISCLPEVCDSNACFGSTDFGGLLPHEVPIHAALGDSHAALFGQGCHSKGMIKTTYGTGSSIMMNIGENYVKSSHGLVTSLAWGIDGKVNYVLEGNINYTGAVITWLKDDMKLIQSPDETAACACAANPSDTTVLIPAFSGLSAPYWNDNVKALIYGMSRTTGRNELIKAALESIAFQIQAVLDAMSKDSGIILKELRVDGGPTKNAWLMQLQSDLSNLIVKLPAAEELSALGAAYLAGISAGMYDKEKLFVQNDRPCYTPQIPESERSKKLNLWNQAIQLVVN